jgi:hypothetical protein
MDVLDVHEHQLASAAAREAKGHQNSYLKTAPILFVLDIDLLSIEKLHKQMEMVQTIAVG